MPVYEYKCSNKHCGVIFQVTQKITEEGHDCPICGCHEAERLISKTNFVLQGGGWEKDGYSK